MILTSAKGLVGRDSGVTCGMTRRHISDRMYHITGGGGEGSNNNYKNNNNKLFVSYIITEELRFLFHAGELAFVQLQHRLIIEFMIKRVFMCKMERLHIYPLMCSFNTFSRYRNGG